MSVVAVPLRSGVCSDGSAVTRSMARISRAAAAGSPRCSSIITADQKVPTGLAMPLPVMSKAEPWIGSNIEGNRRSGLRLAVGAMPIEPASAAARSERMSACRLVATIVSSDCGLQRHAHGHGVDQHLVPGDIGKIGGDLAGDLVPQHHAVALGVRLGDDGQKLARPRLRQLEGEAHDAADAGAGEDRDFGRHFLRQAAMRAAALAGIFAFGILADDDPVEIVGRNARQRAPDAGQDAGRADIGILVEGLADGEAQAPERQMIGHIGRADRTEIDRIEGFQALDAALGHQHAIGLVVIRAPREILDLQRELSRRGQRRPSRTAKPGSDDFLADSITGNGCDVICLH